MAGFGVVSKSSIPWANRLRYPKGKNLYDNADVNAMKSISDVLSSMHDGDPSAADQLLPLVYDELRKLAAQRVAREDPRVSLQATALVHDAYLRLVDVDNRQRWDSRGHFFAAAAEAMRRILVDRARKRGAIRHGGGRHRVNLSDVDVTVSEPPMEIVALSDALDRLAESDTRKAELVKLRFFAGLTNDQAAESLGISPATAYNDWAYARAWLRVETQEDSVA
jgi:RNA polymerase sigma factor (TIGR02999 family)